MSERWLKGGNKYFRVQCETHSSGKLALKFNYHRSNDWVELKDEIKAMRGARWSPDDKAWLIDNNAANQFTLDYLDRDTPDPYAFFRSEAPPIKCRRPQAMAHQNAMFAQVVHKRAQVLAAEMGTGKTLVVIEALEHIKPKEAWYIAPRFSIFAIKLDFKKWDAQVVPRFLSYDEMVKEIKNWPAGKLAPDFIVFDESQNVKTPNSIRSQCAQALADGARSDHGTPAIVALSGSPAPKSPKDWWKQLEIVVPGFIKEGHPARFEQRMALIIPELSLTGGTYPKLVTWFDDERKCKVCGQFEDHLNHTTKKVFDVDSFLSSFGTAAATPTDAIASSPLLPKGVKVNFDNHKFEPSINEVQKLYHRLRGAVMVVRKRDCTDLPEMMYRQVVCPVDQSTMRAARLIVRSAPTAIEGLTLLRELSDGFQYNKVESETETRTCPVCKGRGECWVPTVGAMGDEPLGGDALCDRCEGTGAVPKIDRVTNKVATPKDQALKELLEENEEIGRLVVFAGFTASVERVIKICLAEGWAVIRIDGQTRTEPKGAWCSVPMDSPLEAFQDPTKAIEKIVIVAHPATAKTSLTLTAASMLVFYSNTFNGDDRGQAKHRIHRLGMDVNRGATIVDILHLPSDLYVLNKLEKKEALQAVTLGDFKAAMGDLYSQESGA